MAHHQSPLRRGGLILGALTLAAFASLALALSAGSLWIGWNELAGLLGDGDRLTRALVFELRLPRAMECAPREARPAIGRDAGLPARQAAPAAVRSGRAAD